MHAPFSLNQKGLDLSMKQKVKDKIFLFQTLCLLFLLVIGIMLHVPFAAFLLLIPLAFFWFFPLPAVLPPFVTAILGSTLFIVITQVLAGFSLIIFTAPLFILPNYVIYLLPVYLCAVFYRKTKIPFYAMYLLGMAIAVVQFYTNLFRGFPATVVDIPSIKTALSVMTNYSYSISPNMWIGFVCFLLVVQLFSHTRESENRKKTSLFLSAVFAILFLGVAMILFELNIMPGAKLSTKGTYLGSVVTFFDDIKHMVVEKPSVTQTEESRALLAEKTPSPPTNRPDIVVVMNESLFDLTAINGLSTNQDPLPFYHSADTLPNTETGRTLVSVYGGNTCNSEYEFLTSFPMLFRPQGSSPYMTAIRKPISSWPAFLKEMGYETTAVHPMSKTNWRRNAVYPYLGFDAFLSKEDEPPAKHPIRYTSDKDLYDWVLKLLDESSDPQFIFTVTMQNHAGYYDYYSRGDIRLTTPLDTEDDTLEANAYLSLCYESDQALAHLVKAIEKRKRPTVLLLFGDHAPFFAADAVGKDINDPVMHETPYLLYTNFSHTASTHWDAAVPLPYLSLYVSEAAGLPLSPVQKHLSKLYETKTDISIFADRYDPALETYWAMCYQLMK